MNYHWLVRNGAGDFVSSPSLIGSAGLGRGSVGGQDVRGTLALKRIHGMRRLYRGIQGMQRWVRLSVIAYDVIQIGCGLAFQET